MAGLATVAAPATAAAPFRNSRLCTGFLLPVLPPPDRRLLDRAGAVLADTPAGCRIEPVRCAGVPRDEHIFSGRNGRAAAHANDKRFATDTCVYESISAEIFDRGYLSRRPAGRQSRRF